MASQKRNYCQMMRLQSKARPAQSPQKVHVSGPNDLVYTDIPRGQQDNTENVPGQKQLHATTMPRQPRAGRNEATEYEPKEGDLARLIEHAMIEDAKDRPPPPSPLMWTQAESWFHPQHGLYFPIRMVQQVCVKKPEHQKLVIKLIDAFPDYVITRDGVQLRMVPFPEIRQWCIEAFFCPKE